MAQRKKPSRQPVPGWWTDYLETSSQVPGQTLPATPSPEAHAQWFFEFLRTDFGTLTPGQLLGMRADVWAFVRPEIVETSWDNEVLPPVESLKALQQEA